MWGYDTLVVWVAPAEPRNNDAVLGTAKSSQASGKGAKLSGKDERLEDTYIFLILFIYLVQKS